jgi:hypothetical protein
MPPSGRTVAGDVGERDESHCLRRERSDRSSARRAGLSRRTSGPRLRENMSRLDTGSGQLTVVVGGVAQETVVASAVGGQDGVLCALGAATPLRRDRTLVEGVRHIVCAMERSCVRTTFAKEGIVPDHTARGEPNPFREPRELTCFSAQEPNRSGAIPRLVRYSLSPVRNSPEARLSRAGQFVRS